MEIGDEFENKSSDCVKCYVFMVRDIRSAKQRRAGKNGQRQTFRADCQTGCRQAAKTFTEFHSVQENPDSIQPESIAEIPDSVQARIEQERKAFQDSIILEKKHANLKASEKLMLYVIAHFEGMKSRAYYDKAAKSGQLISAIPFDLTASR